MAAIRFDDERAWVVARWTHKYVLDQLNVTEFSQSLAEDIQVSVKHNVDYLDLVGVSVSDRKRLLEEVLEVSNRLSKAGPESLSTPSIYDDLLGQISSLVKLLEEM